MRQNNHYWAPILAICRIPVFIAPIHLVCIGKFLVVITMRGVMAKTSRAETDLEGLAASSMALFSSASAWWSSTASVSSFTWLYNPYKYALFRSTPLARCNFQRRKFFPNTNFL